MNGSERLWWAVLQVLGQAAVPVTAEALATRLGVPLREVVAVLEAEARSGRVLALASGSGRVAYWPRGRGRGSGRQRIRRTPNGDPYPPVPPGTRDQGNAPQSPYRGYPGPR
jgi:hypothetical protein